MALVLQGDAALARKLEQLKNKAVKDAARKACRKAAKQLAEKIRTALPETVIGQTRADSRTDWGRVQEGVAKAVARLEKAKTEKGRASARAAAVTIMAKATMGELRRSVKVKAMKRSRGRVGSRVVVDARTPQGMPYGQFGEYGTKHEGAKRWQKRAVDASGGTIAAQAAQEIGQAIEAAGRASG